MSHLNADAPPRPLRVLAVDDEKPFLNLLRLHLERSGLYEVVCLYEGANVEKVAMDWRPDIILLDFLMPDMDGGEVFQLLKQNPDLERIPVILLTALAQEDTPLESGVGPRRLTLAKPVSYAKLEQAIHLLIKSARAQAELS